MQYQVTNNKITVLLKSGPKTIASTDPKYNNVLEAIKADDYDKVEQLLDLKKRMATFSNNKFELVDGVVFYNTGTEKHPIHNGLSNKIIQYMDLNLSPDPLFKFWENVKLNPSFRSVNQLFSFLEANDHPLTDDGCFIAYRAVRADFKDKYTGTMDNSPGQILSMPRNEVNDDPNITCSHGLHVANFEYASKHYGSAGDKLIAVKVHPKSVVSIPIDYNQSKMRVCEFEVLFEVERELDVPQVNTSKSDVTNDYVEEENDDEEECCNCGECSCGECSCGESEDLG